MSEVLTQKTYRDYSYFSRYTSFPYYYNTKDKKYIYGTSSQLNTNTGFMLHSIKPGDTLDTLALNYYNNPTFFWAIADFNHIQDPYAKLKLGDTIKIPTLSEITFNQF